MQKVEKGRGEPAADFLSYAAIKSNTKRRKKPQLPIHIQQQLGLSDLRFGESGRNRAAHGREEANASKREIGHARRWHRVERLLDQTNIGFGIPFREIIGSK